MKAKIPKRRLILSAAFVTFSVAAMAATGSGTTGKNDSGKKADPPSFSITLHGFVSATTFWQDQQFLFGNGQNAELPLAEGTGVDSRSGFDIRNTRLWLSITGPSLSDGWTTAARVEGDFFGGFNGSSPYSSSQETPRLRQAYFRLTSPGGRSSVTVGQQWELVFPIKSVPKSLTHVAFPLGFATGMIGWRYPGIVWHQQLSGSSNSTAWGLDVGAFSGQWAGPGSNTNFDTAGNVGFRPQWEARLNVGDESWDIYGTLYYSDENLSQLPAGAPSHSTISSWAGEIGWAWHPGRWSLVGALYSGKAIGQLFGGMAQFGDIKDHGGYIQGGFGFTKHWSVYATYAIDKPNTGDVINWMGYGSSGRLKGQQAGLDLIYTDGPFGAGIEWMHAILRETTNGTNRISNVGNQISISGIYHF